MAKPGIDPPRTWRLAAAGEVSTKDLTDVVIDLAPPANVSNDFTLSGTVAQSALRVRADQGIRSWDDFIQSLIGGQMYVNIHSAVNPGGETRGQLTVTP